MKQPLFKPNTWDRTNKTNRRSVRRPWARAWLPGYVCDYSLMTSSDGLMLQWWHRASPLATHQLEQSVTHGSLLPITDTNPKNTQRHRCISWPPTLVSVLRVKVRLPAVNEEISGAFSAPCLLMKGTCVEYLSADAWNQKPLNTECFKKSEPYHSISARVIWGQGQNALQPERASEEQRGRGRGLFIHIWTLHKRQALFTNQRLGIHIRIYNSFSMRRDCHSGGKIKDRERERD